MLSDDLRHFHLHWLQRLETKLDDLNKTVRHRVGTPTKFGPTWGQIIILCALAIALGLDLFRF